MSRLPLLALTFGASACNVTITPKSDRDAPTQEMGNEPLKLISKVEAAIKEGCAKASIAEASPSSPVDNLTITRLSHTHDGQGTCLCVEEAGNQLLKEFPSCSYQTITPEGDVQISTLMIYGASHPVPDGRTSAPLQGTVWTYEEKASTSKDPKTKELMIGINPKASSAEVLFKTSNGVRENSIGFEPAFQRFQSTKELLSQISNNNP